MLKYLFEKRIGFILLVGLLCVLGVYLASQLPIQLYPQTQRPRVSVNINIPGTTAMDFSALYADVIEPQLLAIEGVDILEVQYRSGRSTFNLTFNWDVDSLKAKSDVESAMNTIKSYLPQDFRDNYNVRFFSGENAGYLMLGVNSPSASPEELFKIIKTAVEPKLKQIEGAELIEVFNVDQLNVNIVLRQTEMLTFGLTISSVDEALRNNYLVESIGTLWEGNARFSVRFSKGPLDVFSVGEITVAKLGDRIIRLKEIADISTTYDIPHETFIMDGQQAIRVMATPIDGGNIRKMSGDVIHAFEDAVTAGTLPQDTKIATYVNPADYIDRSINNVLVSAIIGAFLAIVIVLFFLGEVGNTLLIGISLPTSLILSFILMYVFKVSINLISLGGMALAVGMIVDSSIVVMENIHRFRQEEGQIKDNKRLKELIIAAINQIQIPVIASILTSVMVFLPISFTAPLTNAILGEQSKVVVFTLLFSMVVALTLVPILAFLLYRVNGKHTLRQADVPHNLLYRSSNAAVGFLKRGYAMLLRRLLSSKSASFALIIFSVGLLISSILFVLPLVPKELMSPPSSDRIILFLSSSQELDSKVIIKDVIPNIDRKIRDKLGDYVSGTYTEVRGHFNRFFVIVNDSRNTGYVMAELQKLFVSDNDWYYNVQQWDPAQLPLPRTMDLQISVKGEDKTVILSLLEQIRDVVNDTGFYGWAYTTPTTSLSEELIVSARPETINRVPGLTESFLVNLLKKILQGTTTLELEHEQETVEIAAAYPEASVEGIENIENFLIPYKQKTIPLKHFFNFSQTRGVAEIATVNGEEIFRVYAQMPPGTQAANRQIYEQNVKKLLDEKLKPPSGYSVVFENPQLEMDSAIQSLFVALAASIALIFVYLAFQFNSLKVPLVILVTVPLGFIGVIFSLFFFKSTLSLNSILGTILLSGTVVNNAIIMIDFFINAVDKHKSRLDALVETAAIRFTPIMITSLTTIIGMLPLAIGMGEGSNIVQPLGIAVSGGLTVSTLFTLFLVPVILNMVKLKTDNV